MPKVRTGFVAALLVLLGACGDNAAQGRFEIRNIDAHWSNGRLAVTFEQDVTLSPEARNALVHGVPLTLSVELVLREGQGRTRIRKQEASWEVRYLPLSDRYRLSRTDGEEAGTYPRLRHALSEIGRVSLDVETGALPRGEYELLARGFLDKRRVPPPMRLPVLFSPRWSHQSEWTAWTVEIEPGA